MAQQTRYPFNFFAKMPDLAFQNVTQIMETVDLIMLSDCSKRCEIAIRASRAPSAPMKILISRERIELYLGDKVWLFSTSRQIKNRGGVKTFDFKHLPVKSNTGNLLETVNHGSEESDFNAVISHILFIIPSATFSDLRLTENRFSQSSEYFDCSVALAGISQIGNLMIGKLAELEREEQKKNAEKNVKFILENIQFKRIKDESECRTSEEDWDLRLVQSASTIYFRDANFLKPFENFESFPSNNTMTATLCKLNFNEQDLLNFLKWFKDVPADRISKFKGIKWQKHGSNIEIPDLSEFNAKRYNEAVRGRYFPKSYNLCCEYVNTGFIVSSDKCTCCIDTKNGWDIERSDGLLGTVLKTNMSVLFLVWHERFPITEGGRSGRRL